MGFVKRAHVFPAVLAAGCLFLGFSLGACGLGRNPSEDDGSISDPVVAATVNGRPIYVEDVRARAVRTGRLQEGEDLDANSDAFYLTLEEMIESRLFAMEAEARGLDREAAVRRQLDLARERVLAEAIYDEIDAEANDPEAIERLYRENMRQLDQGQEIHLRHIQFESREMAEAAKRRLDQGDRFEALALELSLNTETRADGGDLGFRAITDLAPAVREATANAPVGSVVGPIQIADTWHLLRVDDLRERGAPSLETLRPRIVTWLQFQGASQLRERLERNARIERLREPEAGVAPEGEVTAPDEAPPTETTPENALPPGQGPPPDFPFPTGPGGVTGAPEAEAPAAPPPAATAPANPSPAPAPAPPTQTP
jgi:peptidyl-prolyl cis-trans isomerase C